MIAKNYLRGFFIIDFLAFFPFGEVFRSQMEDSMTGDRLYSYWHLLYLFRLLRLYKAALWLDQYLIFGVIRKWHLRKIKSMIMRNETGRNLMLYQLELARVIYLVVRMLVILVLFAYFVGLFWYIFVKVS